MSVYCTICGTRRPEGAKYCSQCEAAFKDEVAVSRTAYGPSGDGTGRFVGATMVLAAVVTGVILGGDALIARSVAAPEALVYNQRLTPEGLITDGPVVPVETPSENWVPAPTEEYTSDTPSASPEPTESVAPSVPAVGNELITVSPEAAQDPAAADVVRVLTAYFTAINNHDYDGHQAQLTRAARASMTRKEFTTGFRSTVDSEITLVGLTIATDARLVAEVTFVSQQNAEDGPDGQTCTRWTVGKFFEGQGTSLRIGKALSGTSRYEAC
ncbi:zinc ribbon domain-containing protein [Kribbella sp. C-35]|uniref:zinc ribbon domain-containing protein n=1 Tax=Kribbella sp. C-35 TaxID=2789276 RepID=UPI0039787118